MFKFCAKYLYFSSRSTNICIVSLSVCDTIIRTVVDETEPKVVDLQEDASIKRKNFVWW